MRKRKNVFATVIAIDAIKEFNKYIGINVAEKISSPILHNYVSSPSPNALCFAIGKMRKLMCIIDYHKS